MIWLSQTVKVCHYTVCVVSVLYHNTILLQQTVSFSLHLVRFLASLQQKAEGGCGGTVPPTTNSLSPLSK